MEEEKKIGSVLVVGAGIAGIKAALDLAETGYKVVLADSSPYIGGILLKLDYQFPTDHCGMCRMLPVVGREYASQFCMRKSLYHDNIQIMPFTQLMGVVGEAGAFTVTLCKRARWVDPELCNGCGLCEEACPIEIKDTFNMGLKGRKAVFRPVPHNLCNYYVIDRQACDKCGECVRACSAGAIDLEAKDEEIELEVGALVLASGSELYDPSQASLFNSYAVSKDVLTSLQFERLISSSGTYTGRILRPSDGKEAKQIAWIQCCGSRNRKEERDYCSSICCMFALKEAVLAKERGGADTETSVFYMDMRTFGKGYYRYRQSAEDKGVKLVRARPHTVDMLNGGQLRIRYFLDGESKEAEFDLVVLSTGQQSSQDIRELCNRLGLELNPWGYVKTGDDSVTTVREGILACGSFTGLKDISSAMISGSAAASGARKVLTSKNLTHEAEPPMEPERDVSRKRAAISVILFRWPAEQARSHFDMEALAERLKSLHRVVEVHIVEPSANGEGLAQAKEILKKKTGNRVVFGASMLDIYRRRLKRLAEETGLSPTLVEVVDLRSIVSAMGLPEGHGVDLVELAQKRFVKAIEKLKAQLVVKVTRSPVVPRALIIGGGPAGMKAALSLADSGIESTLVEKADALGGHARDLRYTISGLDPRALVNELVAAVAASPLVTVYTGASVASSEGQVGDFRSVISASDRKVEIRHGATIVATGGHEAETKEYGHGSNDRIMTQGQFEKALADGAVKPAELRSVVMIQCVGSRERGGRQYCSKTCCASALKNAARLLEANPEARVFVLYRDLMSYGFLERHYTRMRSKGVIFAPYNLDRKPEVHPSGQRLKVGYHDQVLERPVAIEADAVVLSTGIATADSNKSLSETLSVSLDEDGFFEEADGKWRPVDFLKEGVFMCGLAHSPMPIEEALSQAEAAAQRAYAVLSKAELTAARVVAEVKEAICSMCERCISACPFEARYMDQRTLCVKVNPFACQGCGICAATCPNGASFVAALNERQTMAVIDASLM